MLVYLVGLPGVGKTTLGKLLSKKINYNFIDLDLEIENSIGITIPEIFESRGENYFREIEQLELQKTTLIKNTVISTGGGTPCFFDNMDVMNKNGVTIYLESTPEYILERLSHEDIDIRPLLNSNSLHELLSKRELVYKKSKHSVLIDNRDNHIIISEIKKNIC